MSANNDFIAFLRDLMYSQSVEINLGNIENRLDPPSEVENVIGVLSQDERRLWMLLVMAGKEVADSSAGLSSATQEARDKCQSALNYGTAIKLAFFSALMHGHGINAIEDDTGYRVRKGFVLVQV